jgi:hypothetical protein
MAKEVAVNKSLYWPSESTRPNTQRLRHQPLGARSPSTGETDY